ncbi:APC family permease [Bacillota bacterium]
MSDLNQVHGVAGLKQYDVKTINIVFMIYCLVAAGAFGIEEMIPASGPGVTLIMLMVFPFIWAWPISSMVAEMGAILPSEGGVYVWVKEAFGEFWGFQAGWWNTVSIYITNGIYVALVVGYIGKFIEMSVLTAFGVKILMIVAFTIINLLGIREVGWVSTFLSICILIGFSVVAIVGFANWNMNPFDPVVAPELGAFEAIGGSIAICIWMYCGYECISNMAGEVKNPQVIPKGLLIAMPLIALTYVLPTMAGLASVGAWENWATEGEGTVGYSDVLTQFMGPAWGVAFLVIAVISQCAIFNTYLASGSRGFFVLADDHLCPKFLVKVSKGRGVPYVGILSLAVVTMLLAQFDFATLVMAEVVFVLALYVILPLAVIKYRKVVPLSKRERFYRIPGGNVGLYFCCGIVVLISVLALMINGTDYFLIGIAGIGTGPIAYLFFKQFYGGMYKTDPVKYPINLKTKLAAGDIIRISYYCLLSGGIGIFGRFFLGWFEGDWGTEYYMEENGEGFLGNFEGMLSALLIVSVFVLLLGIALYLIGSKADRFPGKIPEEPAMENEEATID